MMAFTLPGVSLLAGVLRERTSALWAPIILLAMNNLWDQGVILEAFKPGEEPPSKTKVIGDQVATSGVPLEGGNAAQPPESDAVIEGGLTTGTGGLY